LEERAKAVAVEHYSEEVSRRGTWTTSRHWSLERLRFRRKRAASRSCPILSV